MSGGKKGDKPKLLKIQVQELVLSAACALSANARLVALALAQFVNNQSATCWPSHKTLAAMTGLSVRSVERALAELVAHPERSGLAVVATARFTKHGGRSSNTYLLRVLPHLAPASPARSPSDGQTDSPPATETGGIDALTDPPRQNDLASPAQWPTNSESGSGEDDIAREQIPPAEVDGPQEEVLEVYRREFEGVRGTPPPITSRDRSAARRLIGEMGGPDRVKDAIRAAFADKYLSPRVTLQTMAQDPAKYAVPPSNQLCAHEREGFSSGDPKRLAALFNNRGENALPF